MPLEESERVAEDEALAWRNRLALRMIRGFLVVALIVAVVIWFELPDPRARSFLSGAGLVAALVFAVPALTERPSGRARAWLIVAPAIGLSLAGYVFVGFLSGPGVVLAITLMLSGLLLGARTMVCLTVVSAAAVTAVAWAMVTRRLPAPHPHVTSMTSATAWARSLAVSFLAIGLFGGLIVAVIERFERALHTARLETKRREQAERDRAEAEIVALEAKQLETIGRLAAGVAHDFNNNLTAIIGCAELLKLELPESETTLELADGILNSSQRAAELTRQLLVYSRKAQMLKTHADVHRIIEEAVSFLRRSIDPKVTAVADLRAKNSTVSADASLLQAAILNLLVNARDAMPDGGTLTVSTSSVELEAAPEGEGPSGSCILIEVLDTGRGIARELVGKIFDPFFTTKPAGKGTGLGLAAVAGTVKSHGGRIEVESEIGVGTAFRLFLPTVEADANAPAPDSGGVVRSGGEILLIEDDAMVSLAAVATLKSLGYRVTHRTSGSAGIELVKANPERFELVLLDLRMPGMSGEATFDALAKLAPRLPVLIWSGYAAEQDVAGMLARGAAGFVQKPYRVSDLSRIIADAKRSDRTPA